ncbi:MAG: GGDEF domain-containing protein [Fretibacterium sp.]|nr:GGDEF domain-containing protein [Fretibacterium sp.]
MKEDRDDIRTYLQELEEKVEQLYHRTVELERESLRARRIEKVSAELERHYTTLLDSSVFLYFLISPHGNLIALNHRAEEFFGLPSDQPSPVSLFSFVEPAFTRELDSLLSDAMNQRVRSVLPVLRANRSTSWLDIEFLPSTRQEKPVLQATALDISELIRLRSEEEQPKAASPFRALLDSCPGLLCCAVDLDGKLIYTTRGYREVTRRCLGHTHTLQAPYPGEGDTAFDRALREMLLAACLGNTNRLDLLEETEGTERGWAVTVAPLKDEGEDILGAVVVMSPLLQKPETEEPEQEEQEPQETGSISFDRLPAMAVLLDESGTCLDATELFLRALRTEREKVVGTGFLALASVEDPQNSTLPEKLAAMTRGDDRGPLNCRLVTSEGDILSLELRFAPATHRGQKANLFLCEDKTLLRRTQEQLRRVAATDRTTGVLNRPVMEQVLITEMERASRYRGTLSLIVMDIDGFRTLNQRRGYAASDRILKGLTAALRTRIRSTDFLGRWGGDEFMILTPQPLGAAVQLAEALRDMLQHKTFGEGEGEPLSLSFGVAECEKGMDLGSFVAAAYDAMMKAKNSSREPGQETQNPL